MEHNITHWDNVEAKKSGCDMKREDAKKKASSQQNDFKLLNGIGC